MKNLQGKISRHIGQIMLKRIYNRISMQFDLNTISSFQFDRVLL